jgi:hypothetical protein
LLANLGHTTEHDIADNIRFQPGAGDQLAQHHCTEMVGANLGEITAKPPDRRAYCLDNDNAAHWPARSVLAAPAEATVRNTLSVIFIVLIGLI